METKPMGSVFSNDYETPIRERETLSGDEGIDGADGSTVGRVTDKVKSATNDVMIKMRDLGQRIPQNVTEAGRAIDVHLHQHPRMDVAIVAGTGLVCGALFGRRFLRFAMIATGAFMLARSYPRFEQFLREKLEAW